MALQTRPLSSRERIGIVLSGIWFPVNVFAWDWYRQAAALGDEWFVGAVDFWAISTGLAWVIVGVLLEVWHWIRHRFAEKGPRRALRYHRSPR
jgi:hypothetical protein